MVWQKRFTGWVWLVAYSRIHSSEVRVMAILQRLNVHGITIVLVTHEPDIADYCKRVVRFRDGRVLDDTANPSPRDAASALIALGYKAADADQAVRRAALTLGSKATTEALIKKALG